MFTSHINELSEIIFFMDYNDVQSRLKSIYSSIQQKYEYEDMVLKRMKSKITKREGNKLIISIGAEPDKHELRNKINNIIFNLANIKDCLKKKILENSDKKNVIEFEINNSIYLQLVIDLANQEKHGYPLTKIRRSLKDPLIKNISIGITRSNRPENVCVVSSNGAIAQNLMTTIVGDITDSEGNHLYYIDELINNALAVWERIIKKYNIT